MAASTNAIVMVDMVKIKMSVIQMAFVNMDVLLAGKMKPVKIVSFF